MTSEILVPIAASIGSAVAAGVGGFRYAQSKMQSGPPAPAAAASAPQAFAPGATIFVRLSAEDSDRIERIDALLARLIALEEQTQAAVSRLADLVVQARLEAATRHGELAGLLRGRE